ncbi:hypothetical protein ACOME3_005507 [Neoechinorhynchus agilis]
MFNYFNNNEQMSMVSSNPIQFYENLTPIANNVHLPFSSYTQGDQIVPNYTTPSNNFNNYISANQPPNKLVNTFVGHPTILINPKTNNFQFQMQPYNQNSQFVSCEQPANTTQPTVQNLNNFYYNTITNYPQEVQPSLRGPTDPQSSCFPYDGIYDQQYDFANSAGAETGLTNGRKKRTRVPDCYKDQNYFLKRRANNIAANKCRERKNAKVAHSKKILRLHLDMVASGCCPKDRARINEMIKTLLDEKILID